jgi:DNA-binding PadR family transcriptional regulator
MPRSYFSPPSIDHALLGLLIARPMHGYELHHLLQKLPGLSRVWTLKQAMLYAKLEKLEKAGLIAPHPELDHTFIPPRKYFQITENGKIAFEVWIRQPEIKSRFMRQEFLAKLLLIRQLHPELLQEVLDKQIIVTEKWVHGLQLDPTLDPKNHLEDWMITSFRLSQVQAMLDWLHKVKTKLFQDPPTQATSELTSPD